MEGIREGQRRFDEMVAALKGDEGRKALVLAVIHAYQFANTAYASAYSGNPPTSIMLAGSFASHYKAVFEHIRRDLMGDASMEKAISKMQAVSDLVEKFDLPGIPKFIAVNGITNYVRKSADDVDSDMRKYESSYMELRRSMETSAEQKNERR